MKKVVDVVVVYCIRVSTWRDVTVCDVEWRVSVYFSDDCFGVVLDGCIYFGKIE